MLLRQTMRTSSKIHWIRSISRSSSNSSGRPEAVLKAVLDSLLSMSQQMRAQGHWRFLRLKAVLESLLAAPEGKAVLESLFTSPGPSNGLSS